MPLLAELGIVAAMTVGLVTVFENAGTKSEGLKHLKYGRGIIFVLTGFLMLGITPAIAISSGVVPGWLLGAPFPIVVGFVYLWQGARMPSKRSFFAELRAARKLWRGESGIENEPRALESDPSH